ncbi:MAG: hypothetical protein KME56_06500, partial [Candidatus Thiodiazotropha sp. (ex Ctena orbiculata)]|nr:hypothetical protein [Candidatus Thiodiazotropha taylori]MBT2996262.1 hypothetical protein [Candidatus Thiodiazotropha taylori]MBT3000304.1 hypothetical protein [Candidatus Thiodiazotropha taylori]MBV2109302.1 hypothetical protein [Candidatus Thiodiazotropha taylori]MBV2111010.1 hypothetical protein [Candidatus Thiodiazotropha taylori]
DRQDICFSKAGYSTGSLYAMNDEVHIFLAIASALSGNESAYPVGERHAMMLFMYQKKGTDHDWGMAEETISEARWENIEFSKAGSLSSENLNGKDQVFIDCYESALAEGSALLVYTDIEE